jgi:hypothetical protein
LFERERAPRVHLRPPVSIASRVCARVRDVRMRQRRWLDGRTVLIVRNPDVNVSKARIFAVSGRRPKVRLAAPLDRGMEVIAFTQKSGATNARTSADSAHVGRC